MSGPRFTDSELLEGLPPLQSDATPTRSRILRPELKSCHAYPWRGDKDLEMHTRSRPTGAYQNWNAIAAAEAPISQRRKLSIWCRIMIFLRIKRPSWGATLIIRWQSLTLIFLFFVAHFCSWLGLTMTVDFVTDTRYKGSSLFYYHCASTAYYRTELAFSSIIFLSCL